MVIIPDPSPGLGYGGAEYGYSPYGSWAIAREPYPVDGGYGGSPFGSSSHGSWDSTPPKVSSASSVDGVRVEVFFTEAIDPSVGGFLDPDLYTLNEVRGVAASVTNVSAGTPSGRGYSSVVLTHTGTTLGSTYEVTVPEDLVDVSNNLISPAARSASFIALGRTATFTAMFTSGDTVRLSFSEEMLSEDDYSPGVEDTESYEISTDYPVPLVITEASHDGSDVFLTVSGMTSAAYDIIAGPSNSVSYDGTYLPSDGTTFTGAEVGAGTSEIGDNGLLLSSTSGASYGWAFRDQSGRMVSGATYATSITVDFSAATYDPPLGDVALATLAISDGAVQVNIVFTRVSGVDILDISSGSYAAQIPCAWSSADRTYTLIRNQKSGDTSFLVDGIPLLSADTSLLDGVPTISSGAAFTTSASYEVSALPLSSVQISASSTLFTAAWNFLHNIESSFVGSSDNARSYLLTARGPLVKDWGDATLATRNDVVVRVNGTEVHVTSVNPYIGRINLDIPIPITDPGEVSVSVDYTWISNPIVPFGGLNTPGCVLNRWTHNLSKTTSTTHSGHPGVADDQRFPMSIVLNRVSNPHPVLIGHRYIGFEKAYSSVLNSPNSLLLNMSNKRLSLDKMSKYLTDVTVAYEADVLPEEDALPWSEVGDGNHVVSGGILQSEVSGNAYFWRDVDLSFPSSTVVTVRASVTPTASDGVFTGVGFGVHDDKFLYFVGFLEINGGKHVGILKEGTRPYLRSSWQIGPSVDVIVLSENTFTTTSESFIRAVLIGSIDGFQIFDGVQAGRYTVAGCSSVSYDGRRVIISIGESFPSLPSRWGGRDAVGYVEVDWETLRTYRLTSEVRKGTTYLSVGGIPHDLGVSLLSATSYPAQSVNLFSTEHRGEVFWGNFRNSTSNTSSWTFVRYGVTYDTATTHSRGIVVQPSMSVLPSDQISDPWFVTEDFGYANVSSGGLQIRSNAASQNTLTKTTFGYGRLEPFLTSGTIADFDGMFRVLEGNSRDAQIRLCNGEREVLFSTLMYAEGGGVRRLVTLPGVSTSGVQLPEEEGWTLVGTGITVDLNDLPMNIVQSDGGSGHYEAIIDLTGPDATHGFIIEGRVRVDQHAFLTDEDGPYFSVCAGAEGRKVIFRWVDGGLALVSATGSVVGTASVTWDDGLDHIYRVVADPTSDVVSLSYDGGVVLTKALTSFAGGGTVGKVEFGADAVGSTVRSDLAWLDFSASCLPSSTVLRTIGVKRRTGEEDHIDGWEIPRTDASVAENNSSDAVVMPMDWRDWIRVRVRIDPSWGAVVFRTDLPPPPYYDGTYTTEYTEPSAGWINVEYRDLPPLVGRQKFGRVEFGSLHTGSITTQDWLEVRYRIFSKFEGIQPSQNMVLNYYNVITSGELLRDITPEVVVVQPLTTTLISLRPAHITAARVFNVIVGDVVLAPTQWTFDANAQVLRLVDPLENSDIPVTISFAAGRPVTSSYLASQPLFQSTTLLGEGTPPVPMSQVGTSETVVTYGSVLNDPDALLNDKNFLLNDPLRSIRTTDPDSALYDQLSFSTVDDGGSTGLLSIACDGLSPGSGFNNIEISGSMLSDESTVRRGYGLTRGLRTVMDGTTGFGHLGVMTASGGRHIGLPVGSGTTLPIPSSLVVDGVGIKSLWWRITETSASHPHTDTGTPPEDIDRPGSPDPLVSPNASVTGSAGGSCAVRTVDATLIEHSVAGPWGGISSLLPRSILAGGGLPASGIGFTPVGGTALVRPVTTDSVIASP